ncbi:MAG TPA: NRDE family protein [Alphaproteobacteria bacterium]
MCTLVILRRPDTAWPVLIGANRDEMLDRPWSPPGHHWPDRPDVVAGRDNLAGGSWLGINATGVVVGVLNRQGTLGPAPGLRSRGELVLEALDHPDAAEAAKAFEALDPKAYRSFNLVIADNRDAFLVRSLGSAGHKVTPIPPGLSMVTAHELNDESSARIRFHRPRFAAAPPPDPERGQWESWEKLLASREQEPDAGPHGALTIVTGENDRRSGYGTSSSSLIAIAAPGHAAPPGIVWRFAPGAPDVTPFQDVKL